MCAAPQIHSTPKAGLSLAIDLSVAAGAQVVAEDVTSTIAISGPGGDGQLKLSCNSKEGYKGLIGENETYMFAELLGDVADHWMLCA